MFCSQCGNSVDASAKFCSSCGSAIPRIEQSTPTESFRTKTSDDLEEVYKAVIGPKNQDFYLLHFRRFDSAREAGSTWHWPALFFPILWSLYRKMWGSALIYYVLYFIAFQIAKESANISEIGSLFYVIYLLCLFFIPPVFANALYYNHCKKKIAKVQSSSNDRQRQLKELSVIGGTVSNAVISVLAAIFFLIVLAALAIPAFHH